MYRMYWNLNRNCLSVQRQERRNGRLGWYVVDHPEAVVCTGVTFKVSEAGRQRVLKAHRKNVHAFVYCENYESTPLEREWACADRVTYNPYKTETFVSVDSGERIDAAQTAVILGRMVYVA